MNNISFSYLVVAAVVVLPDPSEEWGRRKTPYRYPTGGPRTKSGPEIKDKSRRAQNGIKTYLSLFG